MEPEDEGCSWADVPCQLGDAVGGVVNDAIDDLAEKIVEAMGKAIASLSTFWVNVDTPSLADGGGNPSAPVAFIQGSLSWYVAAAAVLAVLVGGARMAYERRADPGRDLLKAMITLVLVSGASLAGIGLAVTAADGFAAWIIDRSTDDFGAGLNRMITLGGVAGGPTGAGGVSAILLIILGLGGLLASLVQIVLLVVRGGFLIVLAGVLPLSAAFTNTETGRAWFGKSVTWLLAFILYKPAAAIIYATAFQLVGTTGDDQVTSALTGVTLMVMSLVALPALLRFVAPMVGAAAGGGGGGGGAALVGSVATGAIATRAARGGASGVSAAGAAGSSGAAGPSGAAGTGGGSGPSGGFGPSGGSGPSGGPGGSGPTGSGGGTGAAGAGGGTGAIGPSGGAGAAGPRGGSGAAGLSGGRGATGGGAAAGGGAAGAGVGAAVAVAQRGVSAAQGTANNASSTASDNDGGGPSGSS